MSEDKDNDCLDPENNSKCCFFKVANAFLLLANMLLIILGFHYLPTCLSEDSGYFSVIVAVLGILITVLITWQIWQTIVSREEIQEARDAVKRIDAIEKKVDEIMPMTDAHFQLTLANTMRMKGLDLPEVRSENFGGEEKSKMAQRALFSCLAFSQYLYALKMYSGIKLDVNNYITSCVQSIENMAMRLRGNYDLLTKELINIMISDLESTLDSSSKALNSDQFSTLTYLKQELTHNLPNGIDADVALAEKRKQREPKADTPPNPAGQ